MTGEEKREAAYRIIDALDEGMRGEYGMILTRGESGFSLCAQDEMFEFAEGKAYKRLRDVLEREFFIFISENAFNEESAAEDTPYERAVRFIRKNYQNDINAELVAEAAGCGRGRIEKEFCEREGKSVCEYLRRVRSEKAAELMRCEPLISPEECAELCGFGSEKTMVRAFKAEFGVTPREYAGRGK